MRRQSDASQSAKQKKKRRSEDVTGQVGMFGRLQEGLKSMTLPRAGDEAKQKKKGSKFSLGFPKSPSVSKSDSTGKIGEEEVEGSDGSNVSLQLGADGISMKQNESNNLHDQTDSKSVTPPQGDTREAIKTTITESESTDKKKKPKKQKKANAVPAPAASKQIESGSETQQAKSPSVDISQGKRQSKDLSASLEIFTPEPQSEQPPAGGDEVHRQSDASQSARQKKKRGSEDATGQVGMFGRLQEGLKSMTLPRAGDEAKQKKKGSKFSLGFPKSSSVSKSDSTGKIEEVEGSDGSNVSLQLGANRISMKQNGSNDLHDQTDSKSVTPPQGDTREAIKTESESTDKKKNPKRQKKANAVPASKQIGSGSETQQAKSPSVDITQEKRQSKDFSTSLEIFTPEQQLLEQPLADDDAVRRESDASQSDRGKQKRGSEDVTGQVGMFGRLQEGLHKKVKNLGGKTPPHAAGEAKQKKKGNKFGLKSSSVSKSDSTGKIDEEEVEDLGGSVQVLNSDETNVSLQANKDITDHNLGAGRISTKQNESRDLHDQTDSKSVMSPQGDTGEAIKATESESAEKKPDIADGDKVRRKSDASKPARGKQKRGPEDVKGQVGIFGRLQEGLHKKNKTQPHAVEEGKQKKKGSKFSLGFPKSLSVSKSDSTGKIGEEDENNDYVDVPKPFAEVEGSIQVHDSDETNVSLQSNKDCSVTNHNLDASIETQQAKRPSVDISQGKKQSKDLSASLEMFTPESQSEQPPAGGDEVRRQSDASQSARQKKKRGSEDVTGQVGMFGRLQEGLHKKVKNLGGKTPPHGAGEAKQKKKGNKFGLGSAKSSSASKEDEEDEKDGYVDVPKPFMDVDDSDGYVQVPESLKKLTSPTAPQTSPKDHGNKPPGSPGPSSAKAQVPDEGIEKHEYDAVQFNSDKTSISLQSNKDYSLTNRDLDASGISMKQNESHDLHDSNSDGDKVQNKSTDDSKSGREKKRRESEDVRGQVGMFGRLQEGLHKKVKNLGSKTPGEAKQKKKGNKFGLGSAKSSSASKSDSTGTIDEEDEEDGYVDVPKPFVEVDDSDGYVQVPEPFKKAPPASGSQGPGSTKAQAANEEIEKHEYDILQFNSDETDVSLQSSKGYSITNHDLGASGISMKQNQSYGLHDFNSQTGSKSVVPHQGDTREVIKTNESESAEKKQKEADALPAPAASSNQSEQPQKKRRKSEDATGQVGMLGRLQEGLHKKVKNLGGKTPGEAKQKKKGNKFGLGSASASKSGSTGKIDEEGEKDGYVDVPKPFVEVDDSDGYVQVPKPFKKALAPTALAPGSQGPGSAKAQAPDEGIEKHEYDALQFDSDETNATYELTSHDSGASKFSMNQNQSYDLHDYGAQRDNISVQPNVLYEMNQNSVGPAASEQQGQDGDYHYDYVQHIIRVRK